MISKKQRFSSEVAAIFLRKPDMDNPDICYLACIAIQTDKGEGLRVVQTKVIGLSDKAASHFQFYSTFI